MRKPIAMAVLLALSSSGFAAVSDEQFQLLLDQVTKMNQRLDALEQENSSLKQANTELRQTNDAAVEKTVELEESVAAVEKRVDKSSWTERMHWKGDFRPRYEYIDAEGKDSRNRNRIRARAELIADISPNLIVGIGLASGSEDPVSSNQTLGGGGSTKGLNLDLAYFDWKAGHNMIVGAGKFKNPIQRVGGHSFLMDSDWRPEGINFRWAGETLFFNSMFNYFEGDSKKGTADTYMMQGGINLKPADGLSLKLGAGYSSVPAAGHDSFLGDDDFFGNSFDPISGEYLYDYSVIQGFAEFGFKLFDLPVLVFGDIIHNSDAPINNDGYAVGFRLGKVKKPGSWDFRMAYQDLEADATLGLITDSDFGGGGTDVRGFVYKAGYGIANNWSANMTYINSENKLASGDPRDFDRLQLDLKFKFK